jgi:hypothetical protein
LTKIGVLVAHYITPFAAGMMPSGARMNLEMKQRFGSRVSDDPIPIVE